MQVFEFQFNPKSKDDLIFDSFCYEPENIYERRLGSLYLIGELKNVLPQNLKLLEKIAQLIKEKYYTLSFKSPETAIFESLKKINEFLSEEVKKENVSWLGNLGFAILGLTSLQEKWWEINFTKIGNIKIFLLRSGKINEISKNLQSQEIEPYPLKVFTNIISGKLIEKDKVLILTEEVFDFFRKNDLLIELAKLEFFDEKRIKEILNSKKSEILKISGILFCLDLKRISTKEIKEKKPIIFQQELKKFSFSQTISLIQFSVWKAIASFLNLLKKILILISTIFKIKKPAFSLSKLSSVKLSLLKVKNFLFSKKAILIILLLIILFSGFSFSQKEKEKEIRLAEEILEKIENKKNQAENFLILKKERQANLLFQEAWKEILDQTNLGTPLREKALAKKEEIEKELFILNKIEKNPPLEVILEFKPQEIGFVPQKILFFKSHLYFFNPFSSKTYKFNLNNKTGSFLDAKKNLQLATAGTNSIFFFSYPNIILSLKNDDFQEKKLQPWKTDFNFNKFSFFKSSLYFLDLKSGEIVKYSLNKGITLPQPWLNAESKKAIFAKSMATDGSIWILTKNNQIDRYYDGFYQETLKLDFWPYLKNPTKILAPPHLPYLYLLEPVEKRIFILTKKGEIIKQFQSEELDNLLDFTVSEGGNKIFLLNGLKVFKLEI